MFLLWAQFVTYTHLSYTIYPDEIAVDFTMRGQNEVDCVDCN